MPYPNYTPALTATTFCTVGFVNEFQDNLKAMLVDIYRAKGICTTLKSFVSIMLHTNGSLRVSQLNHSNLVILPNAHHTQYHASTHVSGNDSIGLGASTVKGLVSKTTAERMDIGATNVTYNRMIVSTYTGNGKAVTGLYLPMGFRPQYIQIFYRHMSTNPGAGSYAQRMTETIDGVSRALVHRVSNHSRPLATQSIQILATGCKVYASCNVATQYNIKVFRSE
jgi:hypothetical protein